MWDVIIPPVCGCICLVALLMAQFVLQGFLILLYRVLRVFPFMICALGVCGGSSSCLEMAKVCLAEACNLLTVFAVLWGQGSFVG